MLLSLPKIIGIAAWPASFLGFLQALKTNGKCPSGDTALCPFSTRLNVDEATSIACQKSGKLNPGLKIKS